MVSPAAVRKLALSLPETQEKPHFHMASFRVRDKIFMTLREAEHVAMVKLTLADQSVFCLSPAYTPVPGSWGKKGATFVDLKKVSKAMFLHSLWMAWATVAPKGVVGLLPGKYGF